MSGALTRAEREASLVGVLFLDLDRFKPINDTLGHAVGDLLLKSVADRLRKGVRKTDTVARLGGDEFVVVLTSVQRELDTTLSPRRSWSGSRSPLRSRAAIFLAAPALESQSTPSTAGTRAPCSRMPTWPCTRPKDRGRNTYQFYTDDMNRRAVEGLGLEISLRRAIKRNELFLQYQPQVDLDQGRITGVEALLRWRHPSRG